MPQAPEPTSPACASPPAGTAPKSASTPRPATPTISISGPDNACPDCRGTGFLRLDLPVGHPRFGRPVRCRHPSHHAERLARLAALSGLRPEDLARRLEDIRPNADNRPMLAAARAMIREPYGWLYLYGGPGNAKTEVLIAVVNEINLAGNGPAVYIKLSRLLNHMRQAFAERDYRQAQVRTGLSPEGWQNLGYLERFERLKGIPVLAIDELDKVRLTDFGLEFTFDFLDERYRQAIHGQAATIFAGQSPPDDLPDPLASRVYDGRFRVIHNPAGDARPGMRR